MIERLKPIQTKFDALPVRSRLIFTFATIALMLLLLDSMWIAPVFNENKDLQTQISTIQTNIDNLIRVQEELNNKIQDQQNDPQRQLINANEVEIEQLKLQLQEKTISLIKPENMSKVLRDILVSFKGMKLIELHKEPPVNIFANMNTSENTAENEKENLKVYRHSILLTLEGGYDDTRNLLQALESMPEKIAFESIDYQVENYPKAIIQLQVSTLSLKQAWIGG